MFGAGGGPDPKYNFLKVLEDIDFLHFTFMNHVFHINKQFDFSLLIFLYSVVVT